MLKKHLSLILAALMLAASFTACAGDGSSKDTTAASGQADTTSAPETTESPYDEKGFLKDDLPKDLKFNNEVFTILGWKYTIPEFDVAEMTGDVVENAVYERNMRVEERLGVDLQFEIIDGNANSFNDWCKTVMTSVNSGAQAFDALAGYLRSAGALTVNQMLVDMLELDYINFDQPWWSDTLVEMNTINNKLYFVSGDISTSLLYQMMIMVYNTELGTNLGLENPQQMVLDGKWTQDKFYEMCANVYQDLDNDGKKSKTDRYGLYSVTLPNIDIFYMGAGLNYVVPDQEGNMVISDTYFSEKSLKIIDDLIRLYHSSNDGYLTSSSAIADNQFNSLFYNSTCLVLSQTIRDSGMAYSVLPAPKYDEAQEKYLTCVTFGHTMYMVPLDARNLDMTGAVLECLASEGYRKTTPAVFETAFKYQYAQNEYDSQIFEIIRDGVVFDICRPFHDQFGSGLSPVTIWRTNPNNGQNTMASTTAFYEKMWGKTLTTLSEKLAAG